MRISGSATLTNPSSTSHEILKVEFKNDDVQWDETIIAMRKEPDEQFFLFREIFGKYVRQLQEVRAAHGSCLVVFTGHISKRRTSRYLEQKMRKNHFSSRARQNERPVPFSGRRKANARVERSAVPCSPEKRAKGKREPLWLKPFCLKHFLFFGFLRC